jgi:hypothetical protein
MELTGAVTADVNIDLTEMTGEADISLEAITPTYLQHHFDASFPQRVCDQIVKG